MGHANYQGSMTGESISGIFLLDGDVQFNKGKVSLRMVLFTYFKMADKFSVFAELHQTEEMGPVLAIIPACAEAERLVHMMNKHVAGFLFYFLIDASLPVKLVMDLIKATCDPTLVKEIDECDWDPNTQTITTPKEKKDDNKVEELETATWWKNAFDLKDMGVKTANQAANKDPAVLFDLDNDALSFATVHDRHIKKPIINLEEDEDDECEGEASAAIPSPATPPRMNPNKEATRNIPSSPAKASTPSEEEEGDTRAADGG
jgi:hypothetical protein